MRSEENFEKWAAHFQSLDIHRWDRAQQHAMRRAREERAQALFEIIQWLIGRARKIAKAMAKPRPAFGKPFPLPQQATWR